VTVPQWSTACTDWADRLQHGRSIIPAPIYPDQAQRALGIFKSLRVVDLPGRPSFGECSDQWVFDFVASVFGANDPETGRQLIREYYLLISKKNTKSTLAAGIMLTALLLCWREEEEHLILAPTKEVADNSFKPAAAMVRADDELQDLLHVQDHVRTITHRTNRNSLKVVAADTDTVSGKKSGRVLVDEHWIFGKKADAPGMFIEALGGQISRDEGWVIYLTTQSDEPPAGVFQEKLQHFRDVRDGKIVDPRSLGVLYEFPDAMVDTKAYLDPENFHITNPNIGRSVSREWLEDQLQKYARKTDGSYQQFIAKHLNVEIGMNLRANRWIGADYWEQQEVESLSLHDLLTRSEVVTIGIDGGGLYDLFGLAVVGREAETGKLLAWMHAWLQADQLDKRPADAPKLRDMEKEGSLSIVDDVREDIADIADIAGMVLERGLLPEKHGVGVDALGLGDMLGRLAALDIVEPQVVAIPQGYKLMSAVQTVERRLKGREITFQKSALMRWCAGNARVKLIGQAIMVQKELSGRGKIDPLMALFNAVALMSLNPELAAAPQIIVMDLVR
jgi:phage terminase large subunit-like protein